MDALRLALETMSSGKGVSMIGQWTQPSTKTRKATVETLYLSLDLLSGNANEGFRQGVPSIRQVQSYFHFHLLMLLPRPLRAKQSWLLKDISFPLQFSDINRFCLRYFCSIVRRLLMSAVCMLCLLCNQCTVCEIRSCLPEKKCQYLK
jgi:hypothetical protein